MKQSFRTTHQSQRDDVVSLPSISGIYARRSSKDNNFKGEDMKPEILNKLLISLMVACATLFVGCAIHSGIVYDSVTEYPDGTVRTEQVTVSAPSEPQGASFINSTTNGLRASVSGSQSASELAKVKGEARNKGFLYGGCALLLIIGGIALALPNQLVSNKDALMVLGSGMASIAVVMWVDASSVIMKWVIPALIIVAVIYVGWQYIENNKKSSIPY